MGKYEKRNTLLHESPFSLEVLGNVIVARGKHLLDGDVDAQVRACDDCERHGEDVRHKVTFVDVSKGTGSQFLPFSPDILNEDVICNGESRPA